MTTLTLQRCSECDYVANFRRVGCPRCLGSLKDFDIAGTGEVTTFSIIHRWVERFDDHLPIVLAVVRLEEGVEVMSSVVGDDRLEIKVGSSVTLAPDGWSTKPQFALAD
ncbi:MAG: Zn-ribbon domain-containing OB-fold protein [Gaiellaceae bacterium]